MSERSTPVVFVHGVGLDHTMWDAVLSLLYGDQLLRYDMIGHGAAPAPPGPYRLADFIAQLNDFADHASLDQFDLVGFSMGALVAQGYAAAHPQRVRRMVLLNSVFDRTLAEREAVIERVADVRAGGYSASIATALARWFSEEFAATRPHVVADVDRRLSANNERAYADAYEVFATADAEVVHVTDKMQAPTLVITGSDDTRSTPEMAYLLAAAMPNARVQVIEGVRHLTPLECPEVVAHLITEFLSDDNAQEEPQ
jgi:pimeloyl-ACP methyl ester carboxylesterase